MSDDKTFWSGKQKGGAWSVSIDEDRLVVRLSVGDKSYQWSLMDSVTVQPALVVNDAARAEVERGIVSARERARQRRLPPAGGWVSTADCTICSAWPDHLHDDMSTNSSATSSRFPEGVARLLWICGDRSDRSDACPEVRRCPDCGTYYSIVNSYEWTPQGTDDDDWMTRLKPYQAWPVLPEEERVQARVRLGLSAELFPRTPKRAERAAIEVAVAGFVDGGGAWAALAERRLLPEEAFENPRWTFLEELLETCSSCGGSALDPYAGACYACSHFGRNLTGYRASPVPPTVAHVVAFAADMPAMLRVDDAATALVDQLVLWGRAPTRTIEWVMTAAGNCDDRSHIPQGMKPVFAALREVLKDERIPLSGPNEGWFVRGERAWSKARQRRIERFLSCPDPFVPLGEILGAGYRVQTTADAIRISCDAV